MVKPCKRALSNFHSAEKFGNRLLGLTDSFRSLFHPSLLNWAHAKKG